MASKSVPPAKRDLDGVYFRVMRDGQMTNRCFSDLTKEEQDLIMDEYDASQLRRLCHILSDTLREIGDEINLCRDI